MRLAELKMKKAEARKRLLAISDAIAARGADARSTAEETKAINDLDLELDGLEAEITQAEKVQARLAKDNEAEQKDAPANKEDRGLRPDAKEEKAPHIIVTPERPYRSLGEQLQGIVRVSNPHTRAETKIEDYNKLAEVAKRSATGMASGNDIDGGFLIDTDFQKEMMETPYTVGVVAQDCRQIPISSGSNGFKAWALDDYSRADGARLGGVRAYWVNEADTVSPTKPKMRMLEIGLDKLMAVGYATQELLDDAPALANVMVEACEAEQDFMIDRAILFGSGRKEPLGVFNSPSLKTVAKDSGQAAATVTITNLLAMFSSMPPRYLPGAKWYINSEVWPALILMTMPTGASSGQAVFLPPNGIHDAPYGTLFGRPVVAIEHASALGTVGDILFANMEQYALIRKGGVRSEQSMHVRFLYDEMCFRIIQRVGGAPVPNSVYTPNKGGLTQSAFVTLAAR